MNALHEVRTARASLAFLFEPRSPHLHRLLASSGLVAANRELFDSASLPATALRPGLRHLTTGELRSAVANAEVEALRHGGRIVIPEDPDWPPRLADLAASTPPPEPTADPDPDLDPGVLCLFIRGHAPVAATLDRSVTIVGARAATAYGTHVATQLAADCAERGWTVVSGRGYGIDSAAQRGALVADGTAVAAMPSGLDLHPGLTGATDLFTSIAEHGLLVSIWPPGTLGTRSRLAANHRLLAALSAGTVLVEAPRRSGSLQTLRQAITLGRPAMVVPGPVTSAMSAGCHHALREYPLARLVTDIGDVMAELSPSTPPRPEAH